VRLNLQVQFTCAFVIFILLVAGTLGYSVYTDGVKELDHEVGNRIAALAATSALLLDGDVHQQFKTAADWETPAYKAFQEKLQAIKEKTGVLYAYTLVKAPDGEHFMLVADADSGDDASEFGELFEPSEDNLAAWNGTAAASPDVYNDGEYGWLRSGSAPIYNAKGEVVALLGLDISMNDIQKIKHRLLLKVLGSVCFTALIGLVVALLVARRLTQPIRKLVMLLDGMASNAGDLTQQIVLDRNDELGDLAQATNRMVANFRSMVEKIRLQVQRLGEHSAVLDNAAKHTTDSVTQIAGAVAEIANGSTQQASEVDTANQMLQELSGAIEEIAASAQAANSAADQASNLARQGNDTVRDAIAKIATIDQAVGHLVEATQGLGNRSQEIEGIVDIITGIADQTNLLALNAAIEAARAGEAGRGFAVVAEEVRKLAEESAQAAKKISRLIKEVQAEMGHTEVIAAKGRQSVKEGTKAVEQAGAILAQIMATVKDMAARNEQISAAAQEQAASTQQVVMTVDHMAAVAQESAASAENVSAVTQEQVAIARNISQAAAELQQIAYTLQALVENFKV